ncbi:hypothetical protein [Prescottella equi]|nr:hypothetical protein [Prescottella equi]
MNLGISLSAPTHITRTLCEFLAAIAFLLAFYAAGIVALRLGLWITGADA